MGGITAPVEAPEVEEPTPAVPPEQEQEAPPEGEAPDSGAPPADEAEEPELSLADALKQLAEADPEKAVELREALGLSESPEQIIEWELEQSRQERSGQTPWAIQNEQAQEQRAAADIAQYVNSLNPAIKDRLERVLEGKLDAGELSLNGPEIVRGLMPLLQHAMEARRYSAWTAARVSIREAVEEHPVYRHMSKDEREQFRAALQAWDLGTATQWALQAAMRAAPEEVKKAAQADADKKLKGAAAYQNVMTALGKNGRKVTAGADANATNIRTMADADAAYAEDRISHNQYKAFRERLMKAI